MFRNLALAAIALASIAAAAPASAHGFHFGGHHGGFHGGGHHFHGGHILTSTGYATPYSCWRIVRTPYGPRRVNVCY